jgi:hypothetical protein
LAEDLARARAAARARGISLVDTRAQGFRERNDLLRALAWAPPGPIVASEVAKQVWGGRVDAGALLNRLHVTLHRLRQLGGPFSAVAVKDGQIVFGRARVVVIAGTPGARDSLVRRPRAGTRSSSATNQAPPPSAQ